jgi:hypothetical protein|tara:strand:+ start:1418 stop:1750 length:333 start_codon:yes stop_codon:yes gene_type:complete
MATNFRNSVTKSIGTVTVPVYEASPGSYTTIIGMVLANLTESVVEASVTLTATPDSVTGFIVKDVLIAPNSSLRVLNSGEKLIVASQNSLNVKSNINDSLDCVLSYVEIT